MVSLNTFGIGYVQNSTKYFTTENIVQLLDIENVIKIKNKNNSKKHFANEKKKFIGSVLLHNYMYIPFL